jgi:hypothetical protein
MTSGSGSRTPYSTSKVSVIAYITTSNFLLAAGACGGIVFAAAVEWGASTTGLETLQLEVIKSALATGLFLWTNLVAGDPGLKKMIVTGLAVV